MIAWHGGLIPSSAKKPLVDNERLGVHDPNLHRRATELWAKELGVPRRRVVRMLRRTGVGLPQRHINAAHAGLSKRVTS